MIESVPASKGAPRSITQAGLRYQDSIDILI
jgi:hypothetical protein